jgi:glycosyltransferase involved in cell wall biosynthesis
MKIIQLITSVELGGAENVVFHLCDYARMQHPQDELLIYEIHSSSSAYAKEKKQELKNKGINCITLGNSNKYLSLLLAPFVLWRLLRQQQPDIIHSHTDLPDFVLAMALKLIPRPRFRVFRTIHNTELWSTRYISGWLTETSFRNDTIIAVSKAAAQAYRNIRQRYRLPVSQHQHMIYNGVPLPEQEAHPFQLDPSRINILFAGRLELQKGIDLFLKLIDKLTDEWKEKFSFHIAGDGSFRQQVEELVQKYSHVQYYQTVNNLSHKLYPFDYLFMPSRFEGFGLLSVEASLAGVPVAACRVAGLEETLPPDWPLWAEQPTVESLFNVLELLSKTHPKQKELSEKSSAWVKDHFLLSKMGKEYFILYHTLQVHYA